MPEPLPVRTSTARLISLGWSRAVRLAGPVLVLFALHAVDALARVSVTASVLGGVDWAVLKTVALAALGFTVMSWSLRVFVLGGAVRQLGAELSGKRRPPWFSSAEKAGRTSATFVLFAGALEIAVVLYRWTLFAGVILFTVRALLGASGAVVSALVIALGVTVALPLGLFASIWADTAFARAVVREEPLTVAFWESLGALLERPWPGVAIALITAFVGFAAELGIALLFSPFGLADAPEVGIASRGSVALLSGFVAGLLELWRMSTFTAFDLDRQGRLGPEQRRPLEPPVVPVPPQVPVPPADVLPPA